jgi:RNA polymerase sigma factor (sigma-70 family)
MSLETSASDADLLAIIAAGGAGVRAAQEAFYERHVRYLHGALHKQREKWLNLAGASAEDVVHDTFQRAFDRARTYRPLADADEDRGRRRARAWLGRIAQNIVADSFRRFREVAASPYLEQLSVPGGDDAPPSSRPELAPVRAAFASLSDREQDILRVSALYHKAAGSERLPNAVSAELSARWGISNDNVRAIRSRAMKKLRSAMDEPEEKTP